MKRKHSPVRLMFLLFLLTLFVVEFVPSLFIRHRCSTGCFGACKANLKCIGAALEMYADDHEGHYPATLDMLLPNYLRGIPECDRGGASYQLTVGLKLAHSPRRLEKHYLIECVGENHTNVGVYGNYPKYDISSGLVGRPSLVRQKSSGKATGCMANLVNMAMSLEMYSTDHDGHYPRNLEQLMPNYIKALPPCPAAGRVTYRAEFGPNASLNSREYPEYYLLECAGENHKADGFPSDFPKYDRISGPMERPSK